MNRLYPLKFTPIIKDKIWGGTKLKTKLGIETNSEKAGESWEVSAVQGDVSVVSNGFLAGNNLQELIEVYMGDLVGRKVYDQFGIEFPLLIKFIDATDDLSIQVHPNDEVAAKRHQSFGKTEMWYIMDADDDSELIVGFREETDKATYTQYLEQNKVLNLLNHEKVKQGDVLFLPAGRVHAIGKGILLAEIQQTSDITYRIYDYGRTDSEGNHRELHTELALDVIDFSKHDNYLTKYQATPNVPSKLVSCEYFTTNLLELNSPIDKETNQLDSFVIYICLEGSVEIKYYKTEEESLKRGESILIPAEIENFELIPKTRAKLLEVYIDHNVEMHAN
ncbi:MAG: class I mannose-6-phosphate isomerase [Bacteroidales bacterium]|nr:class I mannose-6-phosphate isomerase [Bacteroidales bacterium]